MGQYGATILPTFFHLSFYLSNKSLSSGKVYGATWNSPIGPFGSWGYDECLLYGNDQAKLKVFREWEWLENYPVFWTTQLTTSDCRCPSTDFCAEKLCWKNHHSTIFFSVLRLFFFNFFFFMEKISPKQQNSGGHSEKMVFLKANFFWFPGRPSVVFEHVSASVNRILLMWWDVTWVPGINRRIDAIDVVPGMSVLLLRSSTAGGGSIPMIPNISMVGSQSLK